METPTSYSGPTVELIEYDVKQADALPEMVNKLVGQVSLGKKTGCFKADKEDSKLTKLTL